MRLGFIRPLSPAAAVRPPKGDGWLHEPKWDGFRFQIIKDGGEVRLYSRHGAEYTDRLPAMVQAFGKLPTLSAILDGELCLIDPRGSAHFYRLMSQMRTGQPDETQLMFLGFDLLYQDGVDLRQLPLTERKRDLDRLCRKSKVPYLGQVETFPDGAILFDYCNKFAFEGRQQAPGVALRERPLAQLGQNEMPGLAAHQCRALAHFRGSNQARANGSTEDARQKAPGARQGDG